MNDEVQKQVLPPLDMSKTEWLVIMDGQHRLQAIREMQRLLDKPEKEQSKACSRRGNRWGSTKWPSR